VPACRTLDCVSVFAHTTDDCSAVLAVMAGFDDNDPYARRRPLQNPGAPPTVRIGVPQSGQRIFFGDGRAAADYTDALDRLARLGAVIVDIDIEPFYETARLLYEGPWLAERYAATRDFIASAPQSMHPVTLEIILGGSRPSAVDAFTAFYRLEQLRRVAQRQFEAIDALALPTAPTLYAVDQVLADPIGLNSRLGTYTNFVNLLDLCGVAVPAALHHGGGSDSGVSPADFSPPPCGEGSGVGVEPSGITVPHGTTPHPDPPPQGGREFRAGASGLTPFGITLLAPGGNDGLLAAIGRQFHADTGLPIGALGRKQSALAPLSDVPGDAVPLAVVGAHLSGMPLNHELRIHQARFVEATATAPDYRLYALHGTTPPKPGLLRVAAGEGSAIAVEVWAMPPEPFGRFTAAVPPPLSIGSVRLTDGRWVKGFLVEAEAVNGARDISGFGGWREFVAKAG
jgi:allophanate hydrolase